jgi:NNP family nitrate/nitrite transporter-like MFS transporter
VREIGQQFNMSEDLKGTRPHEETKFDLPVDSEHKALKIKIHSFAKPHMRAFHVIWFAFFTVFVSTFAPAAMGPVVREDIGMNAVDLANAGAPHAISDHRC